MAIDRHTYRLNRQCDRHESSEAKATVENIKLAKELKLCQHCLDTNREALEAQGFKVMDLVPA